MSELETLKKELEQVKKQVKALTDVLAPPMTNVQAEVSHLVRTLGPKKAAEEINRRNRLRKAI